MHITVKFLGGARSVTGSKYLLRIDNSTLLIDCGLFQGIKDQRLRNWDPLPVDPKTIEAIILTHAHLDHSGYLPRIVKEGYFGLIHCTTATAGLLDIMLLDAAKLQEEEAQFARKKGYSRHKKPQPLFNVRDAEAALALVKGYTFSKPFEVLPGVRVTFHNAGHILGAAIVEVELQGNTQTKKIIFSGDLGRYDNPVLYDPAAISEADILFVESTYGNQLNTTETIEDEFAKVINEAMDRKGCLLIPAFAVGRTQLLLHYFKEVIDRGKIPEITIYVDSPMAINATQLYNDYPGYHKLSNQELNETSIFDYRHIRYYQDQESSIRLNNLEAGAVIISAGGMCTGGRILHHLYNRLGRAKDTVLFVGYQAAGTRGRRILEGEPEIKIFGIDVPVKCHVAYLNGLSAHADKKELLRWLQNLKKGPKMTFVVHGEEISSLAFQHAVKNDLSWPNVLVPEYLESFELFENI